jgi:hypothetical protein
VPTGRLRGTLLSTARGSTSLASLLLLLAGFDGDASTISETNTTLTAVFDRQAGSDGASGGLDVLEVNKSASLALDNLDVGDLTEAGEGLAELRVVGRV